MKECPILFSGAMVRALLDGTKTQTRRVFRKRFDADAIPTEVPATSPEGWQISGHSGRWWDDVGGCDADAVNCPFGIPGDRLWVRESFAFTDAHSGPYDTSIEYRADNRCYAIQSLQLVDVPHGCDPKPFAGPWKPSIHMPRWASRITLQVTGVRVERLQDISEDDAIAEGTFPGAFEFDNGEGTETAVESYRCLWDSLNAARGYGWNKNPWVWVVSFRSIG